MTGTHQVNVVFNGGEMFEKMQPSIEALVMDRVNAAVKAAFEKAVPGAAVPGGGVI